MKLLLTLFSRGSWFDFGRNMGKEEEQERIITLIKSKEWVGQTLAEDVDNLVRLIKGKK